MGSTSAAFSLIQYCPNPSRLEAANIGVVLVCPAQRFADVRLSSGNDRIRRFFRGEKINLSAIDAAKKAIENRVRRQQGTFASVEDLDAFARSRANEVVLTPSRPVKVEDPRRTLDELFDELVGGRTRTLRANSFPELEQVFQRPSLANVVQRNAEVILPIVGRPLKAAYAYRNGRLNLIRPEHFGNSLTGATSSAMRLALEGDLLNRHPVEGGEEARLIVVPHFAQSSNGEIREPVLALFSEYRVRTVEPAQLEEFAHEVEQTAH